MCSGADEAAPVVGDSCTLADALAQFYRLHDLGPEGGAGRRWVPIRVGPLVLGFPNSDARRRVLPLHDLHHILTGYRAGWHGEAEIGAWEVASGCGRYGLAWTLNLWAFGVGLLLFPRRLFRPFVRGRQTRNLYGEGMSAELLRETVGGARDRLGISAAVAPATASNVLAFAAWSAVALLSVLVPLAAVVAGLSLLPALLRGLG